MYASTDWLRRMHGSDDVVCGFRNSHRYTVELHRGALCISLVLEAFSFLSKPVALAVCGTAQHNAHATMVPLMTIALGIAYQLPAPSRAPTVVARATVPFANLGEEGTRDDADDLLVMGTAADIVNVGRCPVVGGTMSGMSYSSLQRASLESAAATPAGMPTTASPPPAPVSTPMASAAASTTGASDAAGALQDALARLAMSRDLTTLSGPNRELLLGSLISAMAVVDGGAAGAPPLATTPTASPVTSATLPVAAHPPPTTLPTPVVATPMAAPVVATPMAAPVVATPMAVPVVATPMAAPVVATPMAAPGAAPTAAPTAAAAPGAASVAKQSSYYVEGMDDMDAATYRAALERKLRASQSARYSADPYGMGTGPKAADNYMESLERQSRAARDGGTD